MDWLYALVLTIMLRFVLATFSLILCKMVYRNIKDEYKREKMISDEIGKTTNILNLIIINFVLVWKFW